MTTFWVLPGSDRTVFWAAAAIVALPEMPATTVVPAPVTTICWSAPVPATIESLAPPQIDSSPAAADHRLVAEQRAQDLRAPAPAADQRVELGADDGLVAAAEGDHARRSGRPRRSPN